VICTVTRRWACGPTSKLANVCSMSVKTFLSSVHPTPNGIGSTAAVKELAPTHTNAHQAHTLIVIAASAKAMTTSLSAQLSALNSLGSCSTTNVANVWHHAIARTRIQECAKRLNTTRAYSTSASPKISAILGSAHPANS